MLNLLDYTLDELQNWMKENNESAFRAKQVFSWIYKKVYNFILGVLSSSIVLLIIQSTNKESNILELIVGIILLITGIIISNIFEDN